MFYLIQIFSVYNHIKKLIFKSAFNTVFSIYMFGTSFRTRHLRVLMLLIFLVYSLKKRILVEEVDLSPQHSLQQHIFDLNLFSYKSLLTFYHNTKRGAKYCVKQLLGFFLLCVNGLNSCVE